MDGGGRLVRPLSAGVSRRRGRCDEPSLPAPLDPLSPLPRPAAVPARALGRRPARAPPAALSRHRACLSASSGSRAAPASCSAGMSRRCVETYGEPHHVLARAVGLGIERVTIVRHRGQLTEVEVLAAAGISPRVSLPFLSVRETRERLEARAARQERVRPQALPERARRHPRRARRPRAVAAERRALHHRGRRHRRSTPSTSALRLSAARRRRARRTSTPRTTSPCSRRRGR